MSISAARIEQTLGAQSFDFACTSCGICCKGKGSVYFSRQELARLARFLGYDYSRWRALKNKLIQNKQAGLFIHNAGESCLFLVKKKCSIYPVRPLQCRSFPFWPSSFKNRESLKELQEECPGSLKGNGTFFSLKQVQSRVLRTQRLFEAMQDPQCRKVEL